MSAGTSSATGSGRNEGLERSIGFPVLMTYLLAFGTGKRLLERSMAKRPGYAEYMRRTSGFIPLPRRAPHRREARR